jgi:hypothetical protein
MPAGKMLAATPEVAAFFMTAEVGDPEAELALGSQVTKYSKCCHFGVAGPRLGGIILNNSRHP